MGAARVTIAGWNGNEDELKQLLRNGMHITGIRQLGSCWMVDFETEPKVGRPPTISKEQILSMREDGMSYAAIGKALGCSKTYIIKVCKQQEKTGSEPIQNTPEKAEPGEAADPKAANRPSGSAAAGSAADTDEIPGQMHVEDFLQEEEPVAKPKKSLKELRKASGLTQKQLAEETGMKLSTIRDYENGKNGMKFVGPVVRHVLAKALHCSVDDFEDYYFDS